MVCNNVALFKCTMRLVQVHAIKPAAAADQGRVSLTHHGVETIYPRRSEHP